MGAQNDKEKSAMPTCRADCLPSSAGSLQLNRPYRVDLQGLRHREDSPLFQHVMTASRRVRCLGSVPRCGQNLLQVACRGGGGAGWRRKKAAPR